MSETTYNVFNLPRDLVSFEGSRVGISHQCASHAVPSYGASLKSVIRVVLSSIVGGQLRLSRFEGAAGAGLY
jgi:hypothetical protein